MKENPPLFISFALLAMIVEGVDLALAVQGAVVWVSARAVYFFAYLAAVSYVRSAVWGISMAGLAMMLVSVI